MWLTCPGQSGYIKIEHMARPSGTGLKMGGVANGN